MTNDRPVSLFDSHCHLEDAQFSEDYPEVLRCMKEAGVLRCLLPGSDIPSSRRAAKIAQENDGVYAAAGIHPHEAGKAPENYLEELKKLLALPKVQALGEIGLDFHYDFSPRDVQMKICDEQVQLALQTSKPVIFHVREAHGAMLDYLRSLPRLPRGVIHCFSGSAETAKEYIRMGFMISFAGSVTFKNAENLRNALKVVPAERLLIETDSPYLAPEPVRGRRNDPRNVRYVLSKIAEVLQMDEAQLAAITWQNASTLYQINP